MNVVAENHADSLDCLRERSRESLIAAVIGDALRDNLDREGGAMPEPLVVLLRLLDGVAPEPAPAA